MIKAALRKEFRKADFREKQIQGSRKKGKGGWKKGYKQVSDQVFNPAHFPERN